ncbi:hypothetical protein HRbin22_01367 [Candidatus Thermoflexus japonica]|uniref:Uncharacterized protein n=1 Tax=Candidatus Thermoflexus japonica TaxID=2035417 RepID=A0A2H5Y6Q6_9CHLR|nr:hypothetical protein HRbin22_01367 [Candidatus Thermoflexus japonica]
MSVDPRGLGGWLIHEPESIRSYRRLLMDERPEQLLASLTAAIQNELPALWSGEAAQGYLEEAARRLEQFRRWLEGRRQMDERIATGEARIAEAIAEVGRMLQALPEP